jgi:hypothetical protein
MSAGRLYDKLGKKAKGKIVYVIPGGAICKITKSGLEINSIKSVQDDERQKEDV